MKNILCIILILFGSASLKSQDFVKTKSGKTYTGLITELSDSTIVIFDSSYSQSITLSFNNIRKYKHKGDIIDFPKQPQTSGKPGKISSPGDELITFSKHTYTGIVLTTIGSATILAQSRDHNKSLVTVGAAMIVAGIIFEFEAIRHIGRAGRRLNLLMEDDKLGIALNF